VYKFYHFFHFNLKNNPNFKLYENMLIILWFVFLYHNNFALDVMYITSYLHVVKDSWIFTILFNRFLVFKNFKLWVFFIVGNQLTSSQFFFIKIPLLKEYLA